MGTMHRSCCNLPPVGCCPPTMPTGRWAATCRWMRWSPPTVCPKAGTAKYSCCAAYAGADAAGSLYRRQPGSHLGAQHLRLSGSGSDPERQLGFMGGCALLTLCAVLVLCTLQLRRREQSLCHSAYDRCRKNRPVALCLGEAVFLLLFCLPIGSLLGSACAATLCRAGARALSQPAVGDSWRWRGLPAPGPCCWAFCCLPCGRPGKTAPCAWLPTHLPPALRRAEKKPSKKITAPCAAAHAAAAAAGGAQCAGAYAGAVLCVLSTRKLLPYRTAASAAVQVAPGRTP